MRRYTYQDLMDRLMENHSGYSGFRDLVYLIKYNPRIFAMYNRKHPILCDVLKIIADDHGNVAYADTRLIDIVSALVETGKKQSGGGVNINASDDEGESPLHIACTRGLNDIVRYLASAGANIDVRDKQGETPLLALPKAIRRWIDDPGSMSDTLETEMSQMADIVETLVASGANVNATDKNGRSFFSLVRLYFCSDKKPRYTSIKEFVAKLATKLVKAGLQIPLKEFAVVWNPELATAILESECSKDYPASGIDDPEHGTTFLMNVQNMDMLKWYLDGPGKSRFTMDVNDTTAYGRTVLEYVNSFQDAIPELVDELVVRGARCNKKFAEQLLFAAEHCSPKTIFDLMRSSVSASVSEFAVYGIFEKLSSKFVSRFAESKGAKETPKNPLSLETPYVRDVLEHLIGWEMSMRQEKNYPVAAETPLTAAAKIGNMDLVDTILSINPDTLTENNEGVVLADVLKKPRYAKFEVRSKTPSRAYETVRKILSQGKVVPLTARVLSAVVDAGPLYVSLFLEHGFLNPERKFNAMEMAIMNNDVETVSFLVNSLGDDKSKREFLNPVGNKTPLFEYVMKQSVYPEILRILVDAGTEVTNVDTIDAIVESEGIDCCGYSSSIAAFLERFEILAPVIYRRACNDNAYRTEVLESISRAMQKYYNISETCRKTIEMFCKKINGIDVVWKAQVSSADFDFDASPLR